MVDLRQVNQADCQQETKKEDEPAQLTYAQFLKYFDRAMSDRERGLS